MTNDYSKIWPRANMEPDFSDMARKLADEQQERIKQAYKDGLWAGSVERDKAYKERNALVCVLSKIWPSHLAQHPPDPKWDPNWRTIVCIHSPVGQLCWHIQESELLMFEHLSLLANHWNGHTTEEKYERLGTFT